LTGALVPRCGVPVAPPPGTFLAQLPPADQLALIGAGTAVEYGPGASLLSECDDSPQVLVLLSGQVKVGLADEDGHQTLIEVRSGGDIVGELESLDDGERSATITTIGVVQAVVIPAERFVAVLYHHPGIALTLLRFTARRLRTMNRRRMDLRRKVPDRLHRLLIDFADQYGEPDGPRGAVRIGFDLTQAELASCIGASDASVESAMRALRERGLVSSQYRRVIIHDPAALRRLAEAPLERPTPDPIPRSRQAAR
jgi:CRP/FNR family cyclic AMP-dependent transcriptional regulator